MKNFLLLIGKILFWILFSWTFVCGNLPPREGVTTEIMSIDEAESASLVSIDTILSINSTNNNLSLHVSDAQLFISHGGSFISGKFKIYFSGYGCYKTFKSNYYIVMLIKDGQLSNTDIVLQSQYLSFPESPSKPTDDYLSYKFSPTFDDPTLSTPESHEYRLEFWECIGECLPDEYDKKTDKKGEILIHYSLLP